MDDFRKYRKIRAQNFIFTFFLKTLDKSAEICDNNNITNGGRNKRKSKPPQIHFTRKEKTMKTTEKIVDYIKRQTGRIFANRESYFLNKCLLWDYVDRLQAEIHADFRNITK